MVQQVPSHTPRSLLDGTTGAVGQTVGGVTRNVGGIRISESADASVDVTGARDGAEELRLAHEQLSRITGVFTADDLLGEIFSRFCIGK